MRLVVDTNVIVSECLRQQGRTLLTHPALTLYQPEYAAAETLYEVGRRVGIITERGVWTPAEAAAVQEQVTLLLQGIHIIPAHACAPHEALARRRVPQDPNDWTLVAAALHLGGAGILTTDTDFLGCGLPTWTPATLRAEVRAEVAV